jgi:hypothetical protein
MTQQPLRAIRFFQVTTAILAAAACGGEDEGSGNNNGTDNAALCAGSMQNLPPDCVTTRMCNGVAVPEDSAACTECLDTAAMLGQTQTPLTECACSNCAVHLAACFQSATREQNGDAARDAACRTVVECAQAQGCAGTDCYCGTGVDLIACAEAPAQGPCAQEIATAAGCDLIDALCVAAAQVDPATALGRANAVSLCTFGNPDPMAPVAGACPGL